MIRRSYILVVVLAAGLIVLLLMVGLSRPGNKPSEGVEPRASGSGPRDEAAWRTVRPATSRDDGLAAEQFQAKLDEVRRRVGQGFRTAVVEPFVVVSDQSAEDFQRVCSQTVRWAVDMLNKDFFSRKPGKIITIYLFRDRESYLKHTWSMFGEKPSTPFGYYSPQHEALIMNIATGTGTLVHEIVHPLLEADFPEAPSWFDEGLASLYEQCRQRDAQIVGLLNWRLPILKAGLRAGRLVPLETLLASSTEEFYDDPHGMHYAQARYLCYYLQERHLLRQFYREFRQDRASDPTGAHTLLRVTGKSTLGQLQEEWLEFLGPLKF